MTTDEPYVPSEDDLRHAYRTTRLLDHHADVNAAFDRFLARVRREAKAEAWDEGYMEATSGDDDPLANPYRYETGDQT